MKLIMTGATISEVRPLLDRYHYLGSKLADPMFVFAWRMPGGLLGDTGEPVAAVIYASPANRYFKNGSIELTRLVRANYLREPLSQFVAWSLRWLRRNTDLLFCLSYADSAAGHHGGIYQALSFEFVAITQGHARWRNPTSGIIVSDRAFSQRRPGYRIGWERVRSAHKYLYIKPLNEKRTLLFQRFGWESLPYIKPHRNLSLYLNPSQKNQPTTKPLHTSHYHHLPT